MDARLPAHLEVAGLIRLAEAQGGFATVLAKGERDGGVIAVIVTARGAGAQLYERMPQLDGTRRFVATRAEDPSNRLDFADYLARRRQQDPDLWLIEADVANTKRFIAALP